MGRSLSPIPHPAASAAGPGPVPSPHPAVPQVGPRIPSHQQPATPRSRPTRTPPYQQPVPGSVAPTARRARIRHRTGLRRTASPVVPEPAADFATRRISGDIRSSWGFSPRTAAENPTHARISLPGPGRGRMRRQGRGQPAGTASHGSGGRGVIPSNARLSARNTRAEPATQGLSVQMLAWGMEGRSGWARAEPASRCPCIRRVVRVRARCVGVARVDSGAARQEVSTRSAWSQA